jgi:hypothetical protein
MNIPDDFTWIVKWGALADLLSKDGPARDPQRAAYCEQRYQTGVAIARQTSTIIHGELQGVPLVISSLHDLDSYSYSWQNTSGQPIIVAAASHNLIAVSPIPDDIYSVVLDLVRNAPIPVDDNAYVQVGREELEVILGYAEHLAMFKVSGPEWEATNSGWENMLQLALTFNERLAASSRYAVPLADQSRNENYSRPRRQVAEALIGRNK